jgi:replicative DNA helicase
MSTGSAARVVPLRGPIPIAGASGRGENRAPTNTAPPQNLEAERAVLGAVFLSPVCLPVLIEQDGLAGEHFYRDQHRVIFVAMARMHRDSEPVDIVTVADYLLRHDKLDAAGGKAGLDELTGGVPSLASVRRYGQIVTECWQWRERRVSAYAQLEAIEHRDEAAWQAAMTA